MKTGGGRYPEKRKNDEKFKNDDLVEPAGCTLWSYLLVLALVGVAVINILALMGPSIGNIFSNVTRCTLGAS